MVLYNPLIPTVEPVAARTFLPCSTSRMTIMSVRRTLNETESELLATMMSTGYNPRAWLAACTIPVAILVRLVRSLPANLWRSQVLAHSAEVQKAGECDSPEVSRVNDVATIELEEESTSDIWAGGRRIKQTTNQKTIGQPIAKVGHKAIGLLECP